MRVPHLLPLLGTLLLSACINEPVNQPTSTISQAPPSNQVYRSFYIQPVRTQGHRIDLEERFNTATQRALEAKGYEFRQNGGDMRVIYALGTQPKEGIELRPVMGSNGAIYTQTEMTNDETAMLALRILDSRDQRVLFQAQISRQLTDPQFTQEVFDRGVAKLLEDFPPRKP
ncbi:hypothetical protein ACVW0Y_002512 [Pseudomonas sp. TE3786]